MKKLNTNKAPIRKWVWNNIIFFAVTTFFGTFGALFYAYHYGISPSEFLLFAFYLIATPLSITMGYHRLFAHMSYKVHPVVQCLYLFFGAAAFQQSALKWASQHRTHHQYVDTDRDPYNIKKGFFYAHIGWLIFWRPITDYSNVRDLERNPLMVHQHRHYLVWAIGAGILLPLLIGALTGHMLGAFLFAVCARLTLIYHGTFCINSVCHMFGRATYDIYSSARDHWFAALLTFGEGYHNYHHHFPMDYRNGVRWYHWDPTKWLIALLGWLGLATHLRSVSKFRILAARLRAQHQRIEDGLTTVKENSHVDLLRQTLRAHYEQLKKRLVDWEQHAFEYQTFLRKRLADAHLLSPSPLQRLSEARRRFKETLSEWEFLHAQALRAIA